MNINCIPIQKKEHLKLIQSFFSIDLKSRLHLKYFEEGIKRTRHSRYYFKKRSAYRQTISYSFTPRNNEKKLNRIKITKPGVERAFGWSFAASEASLLSTVDRVSVEMCCTLLQTRWRMALPKCFHPLESEASAYKKKETH